MFGQNIEYGVNSRTMICSDKARLLGPVCSVFEAGNFNVMHLIFEVALRLPIDLFESYRYTVLLEVCYQA